MAMSDPHTSTPSLCIVDTHVSTLPRRPPEDTVTTVRSTFPVPPITAPPGAAAGAREVCTRLLPQAFVPVAYPAGAREVFT